MHAGAREGGEGRKGQAGKGRGKVGAGIGLAGPERGQIRDGEGRPLDV